ncbi:unnamed protein product [Dicrocoelium dendriticum]|nr:unnamed protein product [Dicrocoelium dendriticum]
MEIRQSLEANFLTCKQCHQTYRKPKVLVCLHTFCQSCLEQLVAQIDAENEAKELEAVKRYYASSNYSNEYRSPYRKKWSSKFQRGYDSTNYNALRYPFLNPKPKSLPCPLCEKETALPAGGVADLPTDQLADKLASMVDRMPTFPVCDVCTKEPFLGNGPLPIDSKEPRSPKEKHHFQSQFSTRGRFAKDMDNSEDDGDETETLFSLDGISSTSFDTDDRINSLCNGKDRSHSSHNSRQRLAEQKNASHRPRRRTATSTVDKLGHSSGPRPASVACLECAKRLCTDCREMHASMSVTANHVLIRVEQMEDLKCSRHPREHRRFFCLTCRTHICIVCTFESSEGDSEGPIGHAEHEILSIREAVVAYQNQLSRDSATTQSHITQIESLLNRLQVCEYEMRVLYTTIDGGVKAFMDQLSRQQRDLYDKVNQLAGIPLEILSQECERLTHVTNEWYEFLNDDRVSCRLDLMDPIEALTEAGPILDRVSHCLQSASEPLNIELARQPFLTHLKTAESNLLQNGDSGMVSSQSASPSSFTGPEYSANCRTAYWKSCLGKFQLGRLELGRVITEKELAAEAKAEASRRMNIYVQTGPELVKSLPPPKGAQRHRAIQVELPKGNLDDRATQTDTAVVGPCKAVKVDVGTQYLSSDVNPPVSMYRSLKQILVQK